MILTDTDIKAAIASGDIVIDPFDDRQIQPASIDLRVGDEGATTKHKQRVSIKDRGLIILEPGDFGVICILERVKFGPQYVGRLGLRSKYARKGLIATTGPQVDPGFEGSITLGLANLTPKAVSLAHRDDLLTLEIHKLDKPVANPYSGPYQGRYGLSTEDLDSIAEGDGMAFSEVLTTLRSLSANVADLTSQMKTVQWMMPTITAIGFAVIAVLVTLN
ncbi:MAG TPA: dCTP deaminase [Allosphingosinicella sp.]|nr:dCTP deaminase [Allosphingosinicella sp.]